LPGDDLPEDVARLLDLLDYGIAGANAGVAVSRVVASERGAILVGTRRYTGGVWLLAIGKAADAMARAADACLSDSIRAGLIVTRADSEHASPSRFIRIESAHPVPDERSVEAGRAALSFAAAVPDDGLLLVLLSGGGSALTSIPAEGLSLDALATTIEALLAAGVEIHAINTVRKHTSAIAGGRLAAARGAGPVEVLCVSDVMGDAIDVIASGPCARDTTLAKDALAVVAGLQDAEVGPRVPTAVVEYLTAAAASEAASGAHDGAANVTDVRHQIIACNADARAGVVREATRRGLRSIYLGEVLPGEARHVGQRLAAFARAVRADVPTLFVAGGETTVVVRGGGRGGRSQELALAFMLETARASRRTNLPEAWLVAAGTDGVDGPTDAAGAWVAPQSHAAALAAGLDPTAALDDNDAHGFFSRAGGLIRLQPTETNVMDLVILFVA
jgi:glycerate 2-kinase